MRARWAVALCVVLVAGCTQDPPAPGAAVWSTMFDLTTTRNYVPDLAKLGASLNLGIHAERFGDAVTRAVTLDQLEKIATDAADYGVELRLVPFVSEADGVYLNEGSVEPWTTLTTDLLTEIDARELDVAAIVAPLEPSVARAAQIATVLVEQGQVAFVQELNNGIDEVAWRAAGDALDAYVGDVHGHARAGGGNVELQAVTLFPVLEDGSDDDLGVEMALDIPVSRVAWDRIWFHLDRPVTDLGFGFAVDDSCDGLTGAFRGFGTDFVSEYTAAAKEQYPDRSSVVLGYIRTPRSPALTCTDATQCCSGSCVDGACTASECGWTGEACTAAGDCCSGTCNDGACTVPQCRDRAGTTSVDAVQGEAAAALAAGLGATELGVWSLEGMVDSAPDSATPVADWADLSAVTAAAPPADACVTKLRELLQLLDSFVGP